jgi:hypothetical protein
MLPRLPGGRHEAVVGAHILLIILLQNVFLVIKLDFWSLLIGVHWLSALQL